MYSVKFINGRSSFSALKYYMIAKLREGMEALPYNYYNQVRAAPSQHISYFIFHIS